MRSEDDKTSHDWQRNCSNQTNADLRTNPESAPNTCSPYETGGVVIPDGLGVSVGLQDRVGLHDPVLEVGLLLAALLVAVGSQDGEVGDDLLGVLGLAGAGLSAIIERKNRINFSK